VRRRDRAWRTAPPVDYPPWGTRIGGVRTEPDQDMSEPQNVGVQVKADLSGLDLAHAARAAFSYANAQRTSATLSP
jgi:hypothetical protein